MFWKITLLVGVLRERGHHSVVPHWLNKLQEARCIKRNLSLPCTFYKQFNYLKLFSKVKNAVSRISYVCALSLFSVNLSLKRHARHYFQTIVLFRGTLRTNKHLLLKCEEHFNGVRNNFCFASCRANTNNERKTVQKCGEKIFRFITELCLLFLRPFLSPADNKCHVSFIVRPQKRKKQLVTEV